MTKTYQHLFALALCTAAICLLYLQPPGFSDELGYWTIARHVHENGLAGWTRDFHDLRWPLWGVCWVLQGILGPGLAAFTGTATVYMCAGALLCFWFGYLLLGSRPAAWACGLAFIFHPLLDDVCNAPWPDLSEAIWSGGAVLGWWHLMQAKERRRQWLWAVATGACLFFAESNRLTGVFILPVLGLATLLFFRGRLLWLGAAGACAAVLFTGEMFFYHSLFGDYLHNLHANQLGKGRHGTEPIPMAALPFRFVHVLWKWPGLSIPYCLLALAGAGAAVTGRLRLAAEPRATADSHVLGRVLTLWLGVVYLEYACAPQSLSPWRPIVRDGTRFLASLSLPISILAAAAVVALFRLPLWMRLRPGRWILQKPLALGAAGLLILVLASFTTRSGPHLGYLPALGHYVRNVPTGTRVVAPKGLQALATLAAGGAVSHLQWANIESLPHWSRHGEAELSTAQEVWYQRKGLYVPAKIAFMRNRPAEPAGAFLSCFTQDGNWRVSQILTMDGTPEMIFQHRRPPGTPAPLILESTDSALASALPTLPFAWDRATSRRDDIRLKWTIPEALRGKWCTIVLETAADQQEPYSADLTFLQGNTDLARTRLRPFCFPQETMDFISVAVPAQADRCLVRLKGGKRTHWFKLRSFKIIADTPNPPLAAAD